MRQRDAANPLKSYPVLAVAIRGRPVIYERPIMTPAEYRSERNRLERKVQSIIKPLLYPSGYRKNPMTPASRALLIWVPHSTAGVALQKTYQLKGGFVIQSFDGFTEDGVIVDATGYGLATVFWKGIPMEDLFRLTVWLARNSSKLLGPTKDTKPAPTKPAAEPNF
jgi:hypothetical protein